MSEKVTSNVNAKNPAPWVPPTIQKVGTVGDVFQGGGGKLSAVADDTGDAPRKPKGQE
jgi:hypothetical protein